MDTEYNKTLDYLFSTLPMYQRIGPVALKKNLNNILAICKHLGNPQEKFKSIHIAGTNGKGSVAHMIAASLYQKTKKIGLYTSPHLIDFRERIKISGNPISQDKVVSFINTHKAFLDNLKPSFFEMTVSLAFYFFAENKVDLAVIEVGLGGRIDSTNIIKPILSVITNISLDHCNMLGYNLESIAKEKAGIIKDSTTVIIGKKQIETQSIFSKIAKEKNSKIIFTEDCLTNDEKNYIKNNIIHKYSPSYEYENYITTYSVLKELKLISKPSLEQLKYYKKHSNFNGRWQILSTSPLTIADCAHNLAGINKLIKELSLYTYKTLHIVFGMVEDKEYNNILKTLPQNAVYYLTKPQVVRGLDANLLEEKIKYCHSNIRIHNTYTTPSKALKKAQEHASEKDIIIAFGSIFLIGDIIKTHS